MQGHGSQGGDYQQYMKKYSADYEKYMQGHGSQGGGLPEVHVAVRLGTTRSTCRVPAVPRVVTISST